MATALASLAPSDRPNNIVLSFNGHDVTKNDEGMINLTEIWRAAGSPDHCGPSQWARHESAVGFIASLTENLNVSKTHIWKSKRGKHLGGVFAHWQIALAYAKSLDHELHRHINECFRQFQEEKSNPSLKMDRAIEGYKALGKSDRWIEGRKKGKFARLALTSTMSEHGCDAKAYGPATNALQIKALGYTPRKFKEDNGLASSAVTRDHMDELQLAALHFAEVSARVRIEKTRAWGNTECIDCCAVAGAAAAKAIEHVNA